MSIHPKLLRLSSFSHGRRFNCISLAVIFSVVAAMIVPPVAFAEPADWAKLSKQLPSSTNAVLAIDAEAMFQSEFATQNNWRESHADSFDRNPTMLPPIATRFLLATELDTNSVEPTHEFAVMSTAVPIPFQQIREQIEGDFDLIGGYDAIHTNQDSYVVQLDEDRIALVRNASRQWASQQIWLAQDDLESAIPELLSRTINDVGVGKSQIAVAVYLGDAVSEQEIRAMANLSGSLQDAGVSADQAAAEMALIEGFVLSVQITDTIQGRLEMVFSEQPKALTKVAKPFMIELLSGSGAMLPEFRQWESSQRAEGFALNGELSVSGLRQILSLLHVDPPQLEAVTPAPKVTTTVSPEILMERATANYVKRVTRLAEAVSSEKKGNNLGEQVLWTDRSAKAIARLSTKNVHSDALKLAQNIARGMFEIVSIFQDADQVARSRVGSEAQPPVQLETTLLPYRRIVTPNGYYYRYRAYDFARVNPAGNSQRSGEIVANEFGSANAKANEVLTRIESDVMRMNNMVRSTDR